MNQEFDLAVSEIRNEPIADSVVEAAAARVWSRLAAEAGSAPHIGDCAAFQALIPDLRANRLDPARATLLRDHLHECVACRKVAQSSGPALVIAGTRPQTIRRFPYRFAAAAAIVAAAGVSIWIGFDQFGGHSGRAIVQSVNGSLFTISADGFHPLAAGAALPDGVEIRTAKDSSAMLELRDGSTVELRERSALTTSQGARDITVRLSRGSVIVQAAHRSSGHLFVATADCRVAVTGTIFGVSAGAKGSRVSVVQGEVHVDQDNQEKILHPGNQAVTSPDLEPESVRDDLAWSRNHTRYESILGSLGQALSHIPQPELRYESHLFGRLPANIIFFAGIPNLAQYLGEAEDVFRKKMAQSPDLEAWWESHGGRTAAVIEKLRAASEYLGGEIAVAAVPNSDGPVFLSEIKRPGFAEFIKQAGIPAAEQERNGLVLFGAPHAVEQLSGVLDSANGAIQSTDFYRRVEDAYHQGAGFLVCANLGARAGMAHAASSGSPVLAGSNAESLIFNETQINGAMEARVSLDFNGPRTGIAASLASPAPMGSLDYVSPEASAAVAAVVPSSGVIVDQLKLIAPRELGAVREALAGSLGGEFAIAIDGPLMPVPSWKLIAEVYDPAAAQAALQQAVAGYANDPANAGHKPLVTAQETFEGRTFYTIAVPDAGPLLEFHYTFTDGYMIAGPSRAVVARALQIKNSTNSLMHSSKVIAMMPRDHYTNFSLVFYQNVAPAIAPIAGLLGGMMPQRPGENAPQIRALTSLKPSLIAAYAEPQRITFAANGDLLGPALASLMRGDLAGAAGSALPFMHQGTRKREMAYR
ncbi:MAG: FecR domain-containing protein [Bryobacteraceae bacterium]